MPAIPRLPDELRRAVTADLHPVRPLVSPARRMLTAAAWAPLGIVLVLTFLGLRVDAPALGWSMLWGPLILELAFGLVLVTLALAESVPARGSARSGAAAVLGLAAAAFVLQAVATRGASTGMEVANPLLSHGLPCFALQLLVGVPALVLVAVLVVRAAPLRAAWAGVLGGAGAGVMAEGIYHLHCPITDLRHVLVWHGAAVVMLAVAGLAAGMVWESLQRERMRSRLGSRRRGD